MYFFWLIFGFSIGCVIPLANIAYLQSGLGELYFGRTRMYGTIGFLFPNVILIFLDIPAYLLIRYASLLFLISLVPVLKIPHRIISSGKSFQFSQVLKVIKSKMFISFLLIIFVFNLNFSTAENIISNYISRLEFSLKPFINVELASVPFAWVLGTSLEIIFLYFSPFLAKNFNILIFIAISLIAGILRFIPILWTSSVLFILLLQSLHGLHFAPANVGALLYIKQKTPEQILATTQGIYLFAGRAAGIGIGSYIMALFAVEFLYNEVFALSGIFGVIGLAILFLHYRIFKNIVKF